MGLFFLKTTSNPVRAFLVLVALAVPPPPPGDVDHIDDIISINEDKDRLLVSSGMFLAFLGPGWPFFTHYRDSLLGFKDVEGHS
jgi:hypothetical protein